MLRTAMRPRALALLALALAVASLFAWLGDWQLGRSREAAQTSAEQSRRAGHAPVDLLEVLPPSTPVTGDVVDRMVTVSGRYDPAGQVLVTGRDDGVWVLAPLVVATPGGEARLPVVRGVLTDRDVVAAVPPPPTGTVELTGRLEPGEAPVGLAPGARPTEVEGISPGDLVTVWGAPVWTAYLAVTEPAPPAPLVAAAAPERGGGGGLALQNLSYALQWWVFAGFAGFLWWRLVREMHEREQSEPPAPDPAGGDVPGEDGPVPARAEPPQGAEPPRRTGARR